jgi:hypothetical protein
VNSLLLNFFFDFKVQNLEDNKYCHHSFTRMLYKEIWCVILYCKNHTRYLFCKFFVLFCRINPRLRLLVYVHVPVLVEVEVTLILTAVAERQKVIMSTSDKKAFQVHLEIMLKPFWKAFRYRELPEMCKFGKLTWGSEI